MKQAVLDRSVARATGESVRRIRQIGFSLLIVPPVDLPQLPRRGPAAQRSRTTVNTTVLSPCA
jgi:hypothetical protein